MTAEITKYEKCTLAMVPIFFFGAVATLVGRVLPDERLIDVGSVVSSCSVAAGLAIQTLAAYRAARAQGRAWTKAYSLQQAALVALVACAPWLAQLALEQWGAPVAGFAFASLGLFAIMVEALRWDEGRAPAPAE